MWHPLTWIFEPSLVMSGDRIRWRQTVVAYSSNWLSATSRAILAGICFPPIPWPMTWWAPTVDNGCHWGHHFHRQMSNSRIKLIMLLFNRSRRNQASAPLDNPFGSDSRPMRPVSGWGDSLNPHRRGGQTAHHGGDVCGLSCVGWRSQYWSIPTVQNLGKGSVSFPPRPRDIQLLSY
jgi:hypothetical protein